MSTRPTSMNTVITSRVMAGALAYAFAEGLAKRTITSHSKWIGVSHKVGALTVSVASRNACSQTELQRLPLHNAQAPVGLGRLLGRAIRRSSSAWEG